MSLEMAGPMKDGAIEGPTTLRLGNKASEDVLSELVHGVKRRLPRAVTPDGRLAEQVVAAYDDRSAKNRLELIGIDIDAVMATVSQHIVKLACSDLYFLSESSPGDVDASWGLGIGRPPGATQDHQQGGRTAVERGWPAS